MLVAFREKRPDWTVDLTGAEDFALTGTAFAFEKSPRDFTAGECAFPVVYEQGQKIHPRLRILARHYRDEDGGVAVTNQHCAVRLLGHTAVFPRTSGFPPMIFSILCIIIPSADLFGFSQFPHGGLPEYRAIRKSGIPASGKIYAALFRRVYTTRTSLAAELLPELESTYQLLISIEIGSADILEQALASPDQP